MTNDSNPSEVMEDTPVVRATEDFEVFYRREYRPVLGLAVVLSGSRSVAEELAQEAFLITFREWDRVGRMENPGAWVRRVVANRSVSQFRRAAAQARALLRLGALRSDNQTLDVEAGLDVWREVRRLPSRQAQAVVPVPAGADEVPLVEVEPDPSDEFIVWAAAYQVGDLPPVNVGQPTEAFMIAGARRDPGEAEHFWCVGAGGGAGCGPVADPLNPGPKLSGVNFGGPTNLAWAWIGVPEQAVAVVFTDQDGTVTWQQPVDRVVIFPDTIADNQEAECPGCRFEAFDPDGSVIAAARP